MKHVDYADLWAMETCDGNPMAWSICKGICWECGKFQQLASLVPRLGCKYFLIVQSYGFSYPFLPELLAMQIYADLGHKPGVSLGTSGKKQLTTVRSFVWMWRSLND